MPDTLNERIVSEEQEKRFHELNTKPEEERNEDEKKELQQLKDNYSKSAKARIDELTKKFYASEQAKEAANQKIAEYEQKIKDLETKPEPEPIVTRETVDIGGKKYYTNQTLEAMVKAGKMTYAEAQEHALERDDERLIEKVEKRREERQKKEDFNKTRIQDFKEVLEKYPHFDKKHPNFNPDDPLYKTANQIFINGYHANPRGLSESVKLAKKILKQPEGRIDRTEDLNVEEGNIPEERGKKTDEVTLTEEEKEAARRIWVLGSITNPKTQRPYTEQEALAKSLAAKKARLAK